MFEQRHGVQASNAPECHDVQVDFTAHVETACGGIAIEERLGCETKRQRDPKICNASTAQIAVHCRH